MCMKIRELTESYKYKIVPISEIQPTELWYDDKPSGPESKGNIHPDIKNNTKVMAIVTDIKSVKQDLKALTVAPIASSSASTKKVFPPMPGKRFYLRDGHHRYWAYRLAKVTHVKVRIG